MPGLNQAFLSEGGTYCLSVSTAPAPVQVSTAAVQGLLLNNLSTSGMVVLIAGTSVTTMSTLSTSGLVPGIVVGGLKGITVSCPPNPWLSAMTTGTGLAGILAVSPGLGQV